MNKKEKTIIFATENAHKVQEVKEILEPLGFQILSIAEIGLKAEAVEDADSFIGNSKIKAEDIARRYPGLILADDSGLAIDALGGFPGVYSARFMEGKSYPEKCAAILERMKEVADRRASFHCVMTLIDTAENSCHSFEGICYGEIIKQLDLGAKSGFGYDPIFYSYELKKTFGRATPEEKDQISHRGKALQKVYEYLKEAGR